MNEDEVEEAVRWYAKHPVLGPATATLTSLVEWTNTNSDGWSYWRKPSQAAAKLMALIGTKQEYQDDPTRPDATPEAYKAALIPLKAFRTRRDATFTIHEPLHPGKSGKVWAAEQTVAAAQRHYDQASLRERAAHELLRRANQALAEARQRQDAQGVLAELERQRDALGELAEYLVAKDEWDKLVYTAQMLGNHTNDERCHQAEARVDALKAAAGEGGPDDPLCCQRYGKLHHPAFSVRGCRWQGLGQWAKPGAGYELDKLITLATPGTKLWLLPRSAEGDGFTGLGQVGTSLGLTHADQGLVVITTAGHDKSYNWLRLYPMVVSTVAEAREMWWITDGKGNLVSGGHHDHDRMDRLVTEKHPGCVVQQGREFMPDGGD